MMGSGKTVWLDMTQEQLDDAYDQSIYAQNREQILKRYHHNSERTRQQLGSPRVFRYGPGDKETLQIFSPSLDNAPVLIFIHGGAWRSGTAAQYAFLANAFVSNGVHLVLPEFDWVQDCDGDLLTIADQVKRAMAWVTQHANEFSGDPERIYLSGHSSGAHLAAASLTTDSSKMYPLPAKVIKGAILCSGMYDLKPVSLSARSQYVRFTDQCIELLSPIRTEGIECPLIIAYGDLETPEFQRQSIAMAQACEKRPESTELIIAHEYNHFEILETLANPYGLLGEATLRMMSVGSLQETY